MIIVVSDVGDGTVVQDFMQENASSGEYSPIMGPGAVQTGSENGNVRITSSEACSCGKMEDYAENPPNLESTSSKCMYNKELSDVPSFPSVSGTNFTKIEIHPKVPRRRHSDTELSIDKILSLASDKAVDMWENDEALDDDAILVNFATSWERERRQTISQPLKTPLDEIQPSKLESKVRFGVFGFLS
ncbi:Uncharacterized protein TCM_017598 [Theobroma cacao]|uniref:Uncharacterized protein n=1 Tax=Theobroma cacao TaxID=3641 RepID=A0A061ELC9_THECC|nr:Uncharacterized protein TCM_017598 [Theobroma cacao]